MQELQRQQPFISHKHRLAAARSRSARSALRSPALRRQPLTCWSHSGQDLVAIFTFLALLEDMLAAAVAGLTRPRPERPPREEPGGRRRGEEREEVARGSCGGRSGRKEVE